MQALATTPDDECSYEANGRLKCLETDPLRRPPTPGYTTSSGTHPLCVLMQSRATLQEPTSWT